MSGRYPIVILNLQILPEQVDVNIHPTKREIKFQHEGESNPWAWRCKVCSSRWS